MSLEGQDLLKRTETEPASERGQSRFGGGIIGEADWLRRLLTLAGSDGI